MEGCLQPETEYFSLRHIWVLLPGMPLYLWNEGALSAIGDTLGKFIMIDRENLAAASRKVGRVLVEMDVHQGLPATLEIEWRGRRILQKLDYLGILFRCSFCRSTTHLRRDCKGSGVGDESQEGLDINYSQPDVSMETGFYGYEDTHRTGSIPTFWRILLLF
jgi:hypothetical protein